MLVAVSALHAASPSGTLPVLYIDTPGHQAVTSKTDYISNATWWIDPMGADGIEAIGSKEAPLLMQIRGRGNYTWTGFDKKPYRLKLDSKQAMLGMNKSRHWALMAHADDNLGFLRAPLAFKLSELAGLDWTPAQQPVEVVLNGDYIGLYFLTETVRVAKDRVAVTEQPDNDSTDPTGGWLLEIDNYEDDSQLRTIEGDGSDLFVTYHSPEILSAAQDGFLRDQVAALDRAFYQQSESSVEWEKLVDKDALAAYYIVQEMTDNYESFHGSCYLHRERGADAKWVWGPVWDFGSTFMRDNGSFIHDSQWHQTWIPEIVKFTSFRQAYAESMRRFMADGYAKVVPYVRAYASRIAGAARADAERWPQYANADVPAKASEILSRWRERVVWLADQWDIDASIARPSGIFLRGSMTSWACSPGYEFTPLNADGTAFELRDVAISGDFKIGNDDWRDVDFGLTPSAGDPVADVEYAMTRGGDNMNADGVYTRVVLTMSPDKLSASLLLSTQPVDDDDDSISMPSAGTAAVRVWADGGFVTTDAPSVSVYTMQGTLIGAGQSVGVPAGIYVAVPLGGAPCKIAVK